MWGIRALLPLGHRGSVPWVPLLTLMVSYPCLQGSPGTGADPALRGGLSPWPCPGEAPTGGHELAACAMVLLEPPGPLLTRIAKIATPAHSWGQDGAWGTPGPWGKRDRGRAGVRSRTGDGRGCGPRFPLLIPSQLQAEAGLLPPAEGATSREAEGWEPLGWEQGLEFSVLKGPVSSGSPE